MVRVSVKRTPARTPWGPGVAYPLAAWATVAATALWVQQVTYRITHRGFDEWSGLLPGRFEPHAGRIAWDAGLYLTVAEHGYRIEDGLEAGFPGYALLIRWLHPLLGGFQFAAVLISLVAGLAATLLLWHWLGRHGLDERSRRLATLLFLLYPYAFVLYGVAYSDSLQLAAILAAFVLLESNRPVLAGLAGAAATAIRPTALVVVPALVVLLLERRDLLPPHRAGDAAFPRVRFHPSRLRVRDAGVLLSLAGVGSYMWFLWRHAGDPLYFWSVQRTGYGHTPVTHPATWLKWRFVTDPTADLHHVGDVLNELAATVVVAAALVLGPRVGRRLGWGYTILLWGLVAMIWAAGWWFAPAGRYLLPAVPMVAALAAPALTERPRLRTGVLCGFATGSLTLTIGFAGAFDLHW